MKYVNGQKCWNGPDRSCVVTLQCGLQNELLNAEEPDKCEYTLLFRTPTACHIDQLKDLENKLNNRYESKLLDLKEKFIL